MKTFVSASSSTDTLCLDHMCLEFGNFANNCVIKQSLSGYYPICVSSKLSLVLFLWISSFKTYVIRDKLNEEFSWYMLSPDCVSAYKKKLRKFLTKLQYKNFRTKTKKNAETDAFSLCNWYSYETYTEKIMTDTKFTQT